MKKILLIASIAFFTSSCGLFRSSYGCPTDGKNVGAEKILANDPKAMKAVRKAKRFVKD